MLMGLCKIRPNWMLGIDEFLGCCRAVWLIKTRKRNNQTGGKSCKTNVVFTLLNGSWLCEVVFFTLICTPYSVIPRETILHAYKRTHWLVRPSTMLCLPPNFGGFFICFVSKGKMGRFPSCCCCCFIHAQAAQHCHCEFKPISFFLVDRMPQNKVTH